MRVIGIIEVFVGSLILIYCVVTYYQTLVKFKLDSHSNKIFSKPIYGVCMLLMILFYVAYTVLGIDYVIKAIFTANDFLVANIVFFGSIFVLLVIFAQNNMSTVISGKTDELIKTLVNAMEAKDQYTRGHSVHVSNLTRLLYHHLPDYIQVKVNYSHLMDAAILHDIGKIGISDIVLNKPGKLTPEEWVQVRMHPRMGKQILEHTSFKELGQIILCHHERVDQMGYYRIPQDQVPVESKIISITDTFSALYSDRVYRPRKCYKEAIAILRQAAGTQLDKELVDVFCGIPEAKIQEATRDLFRMEQSS